VNERKRRRYIKRGEKYRRGRSITRIQGKEETKSWEGQAEDRERHPGSQCGLMQTYLRGLFIGWLICLQPAQQNTTVLM